MEELGLNQNDEKLDYYTITDNDALCIIPDIAFGKHIDEFEWEFINMSSPSKKSIKPLVHNQDGSKSYVSIKEPFISPDTESFLDPGYYSIIFRYRLIGDDKVNTVTLDSAFIKR